MLPLSTLKSILAKYGMSIPPEQWQAAEAKAAKTSKPLDEILFGDGIINEPVFYEKAAEFLNFPLVGLKGKEINRDVLNLIPGPLAGTHGVVSFDKNKNEIMLAMTDPTDIQTIEFLRRKTGLEPKVYITAPSDLKDALHRYHAGLEEELRVIQEASAGDDVKSLKKVAEEVSIINIVNSILEHAVYENASDVHIEPSEKELSVRYRIDGILRPIMTLPKSIQAGVMARIKILANLKIDEHMVPQDGRFKIQILDDRVALRVSILPVYDGEKVVMRILHEGTKPLTLDQLGFLEKQKKLVEDAIRKPNGMILATGPTGSGKTTTLYSLLGILNQPGVNISTIEDPIEYRMPGVNQSQVNNKVEFTFASGLRSLLRQDPNIIMVGEIRDQETAEIAIHAAMTGHLVLSTLHTNDAPTTLPRLVDMGVPPFLVAYTSNIVIAQRLLRKICPYCKKGYTLDKVAAEELNRVFETAHLMALLKEYSVLKPEETQTESLTFFRGEGCNRCGQSGYKGRIGIYEVLVIDAEITKMINEHANANDIKKYAREHGMLTMLEDGLIKAKQGVTTIAEVLRVTKE